MDRPDQIRKEILDKVAQFYHAAHSPQPFVPGQTRIHYAGRVFDEQELVALVDTSRFVDYCLERLYRVATQPAGAP